MKRILKGIFVLALLLTATANSSAQVSLTATAGTTTGSYTTLNAAFVAINSGTHQGAINISVTGNTTEPAPPTPLNASGRGSASYSSINISPAGGSWTINSATGPATTNHGIIEFYGTQHLTIDGDPTSSGAQNLTFKVAPTAYLYVSAIRMGSDTASGTNGASYDTIRNCTIIGGQSNSAATNAYGIVCSGNSSSSILTPSAYGCHDDAFINNNFYNCSYALYLKGPATLGSVSDNSAVIKGNHFGSTSIGTGNTNCIYLQSWHQYNTSLCGAIIDSNDFTANDTAARAIKGIYDFFDLYNRAQLPPVIRNNTFHNIVSTAANSSITAISLSPPISFAIPTYADCYGNVMQHCNVRGDVTFLTIVQGTANGNVNIYNNTVNDITTLGNITAYSFTDQDSIIFHHNKASNLTAHKAIQGFTSSGGNHSFVYDNVIINLTGLGHSYGVGGLTHSGGATVYNNFIGNLSATADSTHETQKTAIGLLIRGFGHFYHNTIALISDNQIGTAVNAFSSAVYIQSQTSYVYDNIIVNEQNSSNAYAIYTHDAPNFALDSLDYNAYYSAYGPMGYVGATAATLSAWQGATLQDAHSISGYVPFRSSSDLHIDTTSSYATSIFRTGTYLSSAPTDIDGQTRNNPPCIGADEFLAVNTVIDSVWPGDADNNRVVDNVDLLPLGLAYDSTGPARTGASIVWQAQTAVDWSHFFNIYAPSVNFKHADCNGDGVVNANDTVAIVTNYGLAHSKTNGSAAPWRSGTPGLKVSFSQDTVSNGDTLITSFILGDATLPVNNIMGLAFTYHYDPIVVDSNMIAFSFVPSWLSGASDAISISRNSASIGTLKAAITRIDHTNRSGNGVIARLYSRITTDNVNGKDLAYYTNNVYISDITAIDANGNIISLNSGQDSNQVAYTPTGVIDINPNSQINLYPNPANDQIRVVSTNDIQLISICDMLGKVVISKEVNDRRAASINLVNIANGVYVVSVSTLNSRKEFRLIISK